MRSILRWPIRRWAIGNAACPFIIETIGMGLGLSIWGSINMFTGWSSGHFGIMGKAKETTADPAMNCVGAACAIVAILMYAQVKNRDASQDEMDHPGEKQPLLSGSINAKVRHRCLCYATMLWPVTWQSVCGVHAATAPLCLRHAGVICAAAKTAKRRRISLRRKPPRWSALSSRCAPASFLVSASTPPPMRLTRPLSITATRYRMLAMILKPPASPSTVVTTAAYTAHGMGRKKMRPSGAAGCQTQIWHSHSSAASFLPALGSCGRWQRDSWPMFLRCVLCWGERNHWGVATVCSQCVRHLQPIHPRRDHVRQRATDHPGKECKQPQNPSSHTQPSIILSACSITHHLLACCFPYYRCGPIFDLTTIRCALCLSRSLRAL